MSRVDVAAAPDRPLDLMRSIDSLRFRLDADTLSRLLLLALAALAFLTFRDYGISWDEQVQNSYGKDLLDYYRTGFQDQSAFHFSNLRYYGGAFDLIAAILNTVSPLGEYETRHLLGGLIGVAGFFGVWKLARLLAGPRAALFALGLVALTPLLYGHNFINPKDAPFAWAILWSIYFVCRAITQMPQPTRGTAIGLGVALGLAVSTRVAGVIVLLFCLPAFVAYAAGRYLDSRDLRTVGRELFRFVVALLPALPVVLLLVAVFWPWVVQAPGNFDTALRLFSHFPWEGDVLFDWKYYPADELPLAYLPTFIALQLPEVVLAGLLAAACLGVHAVVQRRWRILTDPICLCHCVLITAVAMPVLDVFVAHPVLYNCMRHFHFIVPPLVLFSAVGLERTYGWLQTRNRTLARGYAAALIVVAALQMRTMSELHPYEYIYYNVFTDGVAGAEGRFDLDYWGLSLGEAARDLGSYVKRDPAAAAGAVRRVYVCGDWTSAAYFFPPDSHLRVTYWQAAADYAIAIESAQCWDDVKGKRILEVKRAGTVLSYVTDLHAAP